MTAFAMAATLAWGHTFRPATVTLDQVDAQAFDVRSTGEGIALRPPGDCVLRQGDGLARLACPDGLGGRDLRVDGLSAKMADALVTVRWTGGSVSTGVVSPGTSWTVPGVGSIGGSGYLAAGLSHAATGWDHLTFVVAMSLLVLRRSRRPARTLLAVVTAFTVGHGAAVALATTAAWTLPIRAVEVCIALSVAFAAAELLRPQGATVTHRHPAAVAAGFGLLHGLGFADALAATGIGTAGPLPLVAFNVGVELGQLGAVVLLALPLAAASRRQPRVYPVVAYGIGIAAAWWTITRIGTLLG